MPFATSSRFWNGIAARIPGGIVTGGDVVVVAGAAVSPVSVVAVDVLDAAAGRSSGSLAQPISNAPASAAATRRVTGISSMLVTAHPARKMTRHPVDAAGRPLPEPSWPDEPGTAGDLEVVRRFCNTANPEAGAEAWRTPGELDAWLAREGYAVRRSTRRDLERAVALRAALLRSICDRSFVPLAAFTSDVRIEVIVAPDGRLDLHAPPARHRRGLDDVIGRLLVALRDGERDGSWSRLKSCVHCHWVFYDGSNNRSGRWCSMDACGGREKARAYRRRRLAH
jgi:predicted RNA-binding Zn ribbon-like protein